jgi:hypothetical protein
VNEVECRRVGELLPERARGALDGMAAAWVDAHVASCPECMRELALVQRLQRAPASPPDDLAARIQSALGEETLARPRSGGSRSGRRDAGSAAAAHPSASAQERHAAPSAFPMRPAAGPPTSRRLQGRRARAWIGWVTAAAATVVIAVGTERMLEERSRPTEAELWQAYLEEQKPAPWTEDDGLVAGAPVLEDLSALSDEELEVVLQELGP